MTARTAPQDHGKAITHGGTPKRPQGHTARQLIRVTQGAMPDGGHPPGGRCLKVCYCRQCPHYKPLPKTAIQAPATRGTASTKRMAESWNTREEPTWLDR